MIGIIRRVICRLIGHDFYAYVGHSDRYGHHDRYRCWRCGHDFQVPPNPKRRLL